jgi:histidinol-phosphate aminotransferase
LEGYKPGEQPQEEGFIKLNTNENPYPPSPLVLSRLKKAVNARLRLYPDPLGEKLREKISQVYGVNSQRVILGNGSDETLGIIMRSFIGNGDKIVNLYPSYTLYKVLARIQEAEIIEVDLNEDYSLPEKIPEGDLILITNPNTPSGTLIPCQRIKDLCRERKGVVVLDEAYVDFARENCLELSSKFENLIILRTLSKSFSLAGMRIGFGIAARNLIQGMLKVKDSYNLNQLSLVAAEAALSDLEYRDRNVQSIISRRELLSESLKELGFFVYPSEANFVLAKSPRAKEIYEKLKEKKILLRYFDEPRLRDALRITIGTSEEIQKLIDTLKTI